MTEDEPAGRWYRMRYSCPCGTQWRDEWDCACNDRCPSCDTEIEPDEVEVLDGPDSR